MSDVPTLVAARDPWDALRDATAARVALGRAGSALPTHALLAFELDHAKARDAVHRTLDVEALAAALSGDGPTTAAGRTAPPAIVRPICCVPISAGDSTTTVVRGSRPKRTSDATSSSSSPTACPRSACRAMRRR